MTEWADTHCHLADARFRGEVDAVLARAREAGVEWVVSVGCEISAWEPTLELARRCETVRAALGVHPHEAGSAEAQPGVWDRLEALLRDERVAAAGEMGLDYHDGRAPRDAQRRVFAAQLGLARRTGRPVIVHSREAEADTVAMLKEHVSQRGAGDGPPGVVHCFTGSERMAGELAGLGFLLGIGGITTFKNAGALRAIVKNLPVTAMVLETDSPYLTPEPHRGKRNEPAYVALVGRAVAALKDLPEEELADATTRAAKRLFFPFPAPAGSRPLQRGAVST